MKLSLSLFFILIMFSAFAQQAIHIEYYDKANLATTNLDSVAYKRYYFKDTVAGSAKFIIRELYNTGKLKLIGTSFLRNGRQYYDGQVNCYDETGVLREITNYKDGYKLGKSYHFYQDRKLMKEIEYVYNAQHDASLKILEGNGLNHESIFARGKIIEYIDTLGNKLITAGNGQIKLTVNYFGEDFMEEGTYINGLREGIWTITAKHGKKIFIENYSKGDFLNGVSFIDDKKEKYSYLFMRPRVAKLNFITSYLERAKALGPGRYFEKSYFAYPDNSILRTDNCTEITAEFNLVIDKTGRLIDVEFVTPLPKQVLGRLKKEFLKNGGYSAGRYRNEVKQMKLPYWITLYYDKNL